VHLYQSANDVGVGTVTGSATGAKAAPRQPAEFGKRRWPTIPLPWFVGVAALVLAAVVVTNAMRGGADSAAGNSTAGVALPGGHSVAVAPGSLADDVQRYLASAAPAPRSFTIRALDFKEGAATIPVGAAADLKTIARIFAAYPKTRIEVVAYADVPKSVGISVDMQAAADLGRRRAAALAQALVAGGMPGGAVEAVSGNDPAYLDRLTPVGIKDAVDRHPDLIILRK
jgi:outer membrane protein OmpA-like peptidoglycan-associated protein